MKRFIAFFANLPTDTVVIVASIIVVTAIAAGWF
jgi:hypothetical protein